MKRLLAIKALNAVIKECSIGSSRNNVEINDLSEVVLEIVRAQAIIVIIIP